MNTEAVLSGPLYEFLSQGIAEAIASGKSEKWLPINQVFAHLKIQDKDPHYGFIFFDLSWNSGVIIPSSLLLTIKEGNNIVLSENVHMVPLSDRDHEKYSGRENMCRTSSVMLTTRQFGQIDNSPDVCVIFSDKEQEMFFDHYIISE